MTEVRVKRVYEAPESCDGKRILVDRLWPRGLTRDAASVDLWLKEAAPSPELRRWFGHSPAKWSEFKRRYCAELAHNDALAELKRLARDEPTITLLFAAKDVAHNNAEVLREALNRNLAD